MTTEGDELILVPRENWVISVEVKKDILLRPTTRGEESPLSEGTSLFKDEGKQGVYQKPFRSGIERSEDSFSEISSLSEM